VKKILIDGEVGGNRREVCPSLRGNLARSTVRRTTSLGSYGRFLILPIYIYITMLLDQISYRQIGILNRMVAYRDRNKEPKCMQW